MLVRLFISHILLMNNYPFQLFVILKLTSSGYDMQVISRDDTECYDNLKDDEVVKENPLDNGVGDI